MGREAALLAIILIHEWLVCAYHVLGHGSPGDVVTQQRQFRRDPWSTPGLGSLSTYAESDTRFQYAHFASSFTVKIGHSRQTLDIEQMMQVLDSERGRNYW